MQLAQRVAVVTGVAGGLGSAIARRFAREGARLVLRDINEAAVVRQLAAELAAEGAHCLALRCDVSSSASVAEMFAAADARFGTEFAQPVQGERWPGAVTQQTLASGTVSSLDVHRAVDRKATAMRPLPHRA